MIKRFIYFSLAILFGLFSSFTKAGGFSFVKITGDYHDILYSGKIESGDADKLLGLMILNQRNSYRSVVLNSPGGDVEEAIKVADLIKQLALTTKVANQGVCASACFFVWLSGDQRLAGVSGKHIGRIGLHRPYQSNPSNNKSSIDKQIVIQQIVSKYMQEQLVPTRLIDAMMNKPSNDLYWLKMADLDEIGEYQPGTEELYIKKCDYKRTDEINLYRMEDRGDIVGAMRIKDKMDKVNKCIIYLSLERRMVALIEFLKIIESIEDKKGGLRRER